MMNSVGRNTSGRENISFSKRNIYFFRRLHQSFANEQEMLTANVRLRKHRNFVTSITDIIVCIFSLKISFLGDFRSSLETLRRIVPRGYRSFEIAVVAIDYSLSE